MRIIYCVNSTNAGLTQHRGEMQNRYAIVTGLVASGALLAACGSSTVQGVSSRTAGAKTQSSKPTKILPIPSGTVSASSPLPNGTLWVVAGNAASKGIFQISLSSGKVDASVSVSNDASAVAQATTGEICLGIASPSGGGAVQFRSGVTGGLLSTVPLSGAVIALTAGSDAKTFYALTRVGSAMSVSIVQDTNGKVISTVPAPKAAVSLAVTPSERHVYVLQSDGIMSEISTSNGQVDSQFSIGRSGYFAAMSSDGSSLYVLKGQDPNRNVAVVQLSTESVKKVLPAAASSVAVALSPDGTQLYDVIGNASVGNIQIYKLG